LLLLKALQAALFEPPALALGQLELILKQPLGEGIGSHHKQVIDPQRMGW
jgi:hypothetical protein